MLVLSKPSKYIFLVVLFTLFSCHKDPKSHLEFVNGYWEIEQVTFPNGETKTYNFNETIDYIEIKDNMKGFRKKMKPNINQTFSTSNNEEMIEAKIENDSLNLYYATPLSTWKETVISTDENQLIIALDNEVTYQYKRYKPLDINISENE